MNTTQTSQNSEVDAVEDVKPAVYETNLLPKAELIHYTVSVSIEPKVRQKEEQFNGRSLVEMGNLAAAGELSDEEMKLCEIYMNEFRDKSLAGEKLDSNGKIITDNYCTKVINNVFMA